jgi:hypothetical protein
MGSQADRQEHLVRLEPGVEVVQVALATPAAAKVTKVKTAIPGTLVFQEDRLP